MAETMAVCVLLYLSMALPAACAVYEGRGKFITSYTDAYWEEGLRIVYRPENYNKCECDVMFIKKYFGVPFILI